eukprot:4924728-Pyramimonas_sp.AAC.1
MRDWLRPGERSSQAEAKAKVKEKTGQITTGTGNGGSATASCPWPQNRSGNVDCVAAPRTWRAWTVANTATTIGLRPQRASI